MRGQHHRNIQEVATRIGVSEDCITYWENGLATPQIQFYPKIIQFLAYTPFALDTNTLGGEIKTYRLLNGLSHKKMGEICGVNASTISAWETQKSKPQPSSVITLKLLLATVK